MQNASDPNWAKRFGLPKAKYVIKQIISEHKKQQSIDLHLNHKPDSMTVLNHGKWSCYMFKREIWSALERAKLSYQALKQVTYICLQSS